MTLRSAHWRSLIVVLVVALSSVLVASARSGNDGITDTIGGGVLIDGSAMKVGVYGTWPGLIGARFDGNPVGLFYEDDNGLAGGGGAAFGIHSGGNATSSWGGFTGTASPVTTGTGSAASPWIVTSSWTVNGTSLAITQVVRHVDGAHSYRVSWAITNTSGSSATFSAYNGVDLYVQGSDSGVGVFTSGPPRFVAGRAGDGTTVGITEVTPWSHYYEGDYGVATAPLGDPSAGYDNTTNPVSVDNGVGVSWEGITLAAGGTTTISDIWGFVSSGGAAAPAHAPTIDSSPTDPSTAAGSFSFSGHGGDTYAGFECSLDGGGFDPCASPFAFSGLAVGSHTFAVHEVNSDGDAGADATHTWNVGAADTTPPAAPTLSSISATTTATSASFTFTGEPSGPFDCRLDGGSWTSCTSPAAYASLATGNHSFGVRQTDLAGNVGTASEDTWTISGLDVTAPAAPTLSTIPANTTETSATFTFTGEPSGPFDCRLDGDTWTTCASPAVHASLTVGIHTFEVRQTDLAGNVGTVAQNVWSVDGPTTTATPEPTTTTVGPAPTAQPPRPTPPIVVTAVPASPVVPADNLPPIHQATFGSHTVDLHVPAGTTHVLVSRSSDLADAQLVAVDPDGTIHVTLPDSVQGAVQLWVAQPDGTSPTSATVTIDTIKPRLLSAIRVTSVKKRHNSVRAARETTLLVTTPHKRYWIKLVGVDTGTGLTSLQLSPTPGVTWRWRSILTAFTARTNTKHLRVRVADGAGNTSGWLNVQLQTINPR